MSIPTENDIAILLSTGEGQGLEFKRSVSSSVAREMVAFANAEGGRIIFGVDDKNRVVGIDEVNRTTSAVQSTARNCDPPILAAIHPIKIGDKSILVVDIPNGHKKPYACHDGYFLRIGATSQKMNRDELVRFVQKNSPIHFDDMICPSFTSNDFDEKAYRSFLDRAHIDTGGIDSLDVLRNLGLLGPKNDVEPVYKNATVLFFGKEPVRFIRQAIVTCVLFAGTDKSDILDRKDLDGNLAENVRQAMAFLKRHLSLRYEIKTLVREEILELPEQALREALLNAVSHRDYSISGAVVMVEIYRDRVEIVSPGGLPAGLKQSELGKRSVHRNPLIADMFHRLGEVERVGSGISRILGVAKAADVPVPVFETNGFFSVIFAKPENVREKTDKKWNVPRVETKSGVESGVESEMANHILVFLRKDTLGKKEIAAKLGKSKPTRYLNDLVSKMIDAKLIKYTIPDKPNSSMQRYLLTKKGRGILKTISSRKKR